MAIAVLISSVALLMTALVWLGTYRAIRRLETRIMPLIPRVAELLADSRQTMEVALQQFRETSEKTHALLDDMRGEVHQFGVIRAELATRLQAQLGRVETALDDSLADIQEVVATVHGSVIRPVREVTGWLSAVRAACRTFFSRQAPAEKDTTPGQQNLAG
jgi:hypothetical protein